jgi:hypothetical protein
MMTGAGLVFFISYFRLFCRTSSETQNGVGKLDADKTATQNITFFSVGLVTILEKISNIYPE